MDVMRSQERERAASRNEEEMHSTGVLMEKEEEIRCLNEEVT